MSKIVALKMLTGEDLIVDIVTEQDKYFTVKAPALIIIQQNGNGEVGVGMQPYAPMASGNVDIYKSALSAYYEVDMQVQNEYSRLFGSGIVIANAMPPGISK